MNDDALDLSELDGTGIRLCYGLTASLAKDELMFSKRNMKRELERFHQTHKSMSGSISRNSNPKSFAKPSHISPVLARHFSQRAAGRPLIFV